MGMYPCPCLARVEELFSRRACSPCPGARAVEHLDAARKRDRLNGDGSVLNSGVFFRPRFFAGTSVSSAQRRRLKIVTASRVGADRWIVLRIGSVSGRTN